MISGLLHCSSKPISRSRGFTLIEVMVVVVIVGLLSSMAAVSMSHNHQRAKVTAFFASLKAYHQLLDQCMLDTGRLDVGSSPGSLSNAFAPYVRFGQWSQETPIGGKWDVDSNTNNGVWITIGVEGHNADSKTIQMIDDLFDNGDVNSGNLRSMSSQKYCWVVQE